MHSTFRWGRWKVAGLLAGVIALGRALVSTELAPAPGSDPQLVREAEPAAAAAGAGTSAFRIVGAPVRLGVSVWRVTWESVAGRRYLLQRWSTDELGTAAEPRWTDVVTVRASGSVTSAEDPTAAFTNRRYYRVGLLPETGGDGEAPVVSAIKPRFTAANNASAAELTLTATDNVGVSSVTILNGSAVLGSARRGENGAWSFTLPLNPKELGARFLVARAVDAAGNIGHSPVFPLGLVDPDHFVPLGADGLPVEGGIVPAVAAGVWGAVEYRPGGRNMLGFGPGFFLRFPRGVRLINEAGGQFLEFTEVIAGFGARYPLQFVRPLVRTSGPLRRLRVGPVNVADVLAIFDLDPAVGVEVRVYDRFPLRWHAGIVDDGGIRGARFGFVSTGLPLPGTSGEYPDLAVDFTRTTGVRLPFHGEFALPDGTASPLRLRAGDTNPLWLTLSPDGRVSLVGSAEVVFPNGGYAHVYLALEEPHYRIQFEADRLHARTLNGFVDLLPANPAVCLPGAATAAQLAVATRCLDAHARAYVNFSASVAGLASSDAASVATRPAVPPDPFSTVSSVIEAWGFGTTASTAQRLPLDLIRDVVRQAGPSAAAAADLNTALAQRLALLRALQAARSSAATATPESLAELEAALVEVETAGLIRANDPDAVSSLESLSTTVRLLVDAEALRQLLGRPASPILTTALPGLLQRFADRFTTGLGVQAGTFTPVLNPVIGSMNRFVATEQVHKLVEFLAMVQILGVDLAPTAIDEALGQLAIRLSTLATADLTVAEQQDDMPGFVLAFQDLLDVVAAHQLAIFPNNAVVVAGVPSAAQVPGLAQRLDALLERDLTRPLGERTFNNTAAEIRALLRVLRQMPAGVTFADASFRRAFDRMEASLAAATGATALAAEGRLANLQQLLEAGMLHSELGTRFGFASAEDWETGRLPRVVGRISAVSTGGLSWSELDQSVRQLLGAADRLGLVGDQAARLACLQQAAVLLGTSRSVAGAMMRNSGGALKLADMLLPGEIRVENVAGFANYDTRSGSLSGSFRGALFLPKFTSALVINNASLAPGGAFDLNLFGSAPFPGGRMTIPGRRPLRMSFDPPGDLRFRGAGRLEFTSGMAFDSFLTLDDPYYAFGIAAQGLRFSLGRELVLRIPTLSAAQVGAFTDTTRDAFQQYFRNLGATMETLVGAVTNFPAIDQTDIGRPPEFVAPQITLNLDELNALADTFLLPAQAGLADLINATFGGAREKLLALNREATEARDALLSERELLENQIQRLAARRKAKEAFQSAATAMAGNAEAEGKANQLLAAGTDGLRQEILLTYRLVTPGLLADLPGALRLAKVFVGYGASVQDQAASFADLDGDGVPNATDKCPAFPENAQRDTDNDGVGDACDEQPGNAAVPGNSALALIRRKGDDVLEAGRILAFAAATNRFGQLGLRPDTGAVADVARFEALTEDELELNSRLFLALAANSDLLGEDGGSTAFLTGARTVHRRLGTLLTNRFANALPDDYRRKYDVGRRLIWAASVAQSFGDDAYPVSAGVVAQDIIPVLNRIPTSELAQFAREVDLAQAQRQDLLVRTVQREVSAGSRSDDLADLLDESPGFVFDLGELFRVLSLPVPAEFNTKIGDLVRYQLEQLRLRTISPDFLRQRASDAIGALDTLIGMAGWVSRNMPGDVASLTKLQTTLEAVTIPLTAVAEARKEWWVVERYYERLRAANRLYGANLNAGLRQAFGQAGTGTLMAAQRIGTAMGQLLQQVRLETVTLQLPGEVRVPQAFGSVFFNRATEQISGSFGGRIELPGLGGTLEILNASVSNGGDFDVNAFGSLQVPVGAPIGTISIPARRPLHLSHQAPNLTSLSGGLRLDLTNGMHFEGYLGLEDPVYTFGVSAGGLKFDLIQKLIVTKPVLTGLEPFRQEVATVLTEYLDRLNAGFESLAVLGDPLELDPAGQRPDFRAPAVTLEFDAIEAFANSVNLAVTQARVASHEAAYGALKSTLGAIAGGASHLRQTLGGVLTDLDSRATDLQRQEDYNTAMEVLASALSLMAAHAEVGSPVPIRESAEFAAAMNAGRTNTVALLRSPTVVQSLPSIRQVARLALNFAAAEQLTGQAGGESVFNELPDFFEAGRSNLFVRLGLNPRTGSVANAAVLEAIPLTLLDNQVKDLIGYAADLQAAGVGAGVDELPVIQAAAGTLSNRQRTLILERLCAEPGMHFHDRQFLVSTLWDLMATEQDGVFSWPSVVSRFDCTTGPRNPNADVAGLVAQSERVVRDRRIDALAGRIERSLQQDNAILYTLSRMQVRFNFNLQNDVLAEVQRGLRAQLDRLDALVLQSWPRDRLRDGVGLLQEIIDLAEALEGFGMPTELGRLRTITLPGITVQFTAVAEAQKAWWELSDFSRRLLHASGRRVGGNATALADAFVSSASASIRAADRISQAFVALLPTFERQDFHLPGDDLVIREVFGNLLYNRETQFLRGELGGRLEFPSLGTNVFLQVSRASIATDGSFSIHAATGTPLPFGRVRLNADIVVDSTRSGGWDLAGNGQILVPSNTSTQTFNVSLGYDQSANRLRVSTLAQNLNVRFSDDFVLFDAGFGFDVSLDQPRGRFTAVGSAGMYARNKPLPAAITRDSFQLVADAVTTSFQYEPGGSTVNLDNGTLRLPPMFTQSICPTNPPGTASGPAVLLTPGTPISVNYRETPQSVSFGGALEFRNLGFQVPGLTNLAVEVCSARLAFLANQLPRLTNLNATIRIPLPGQTNRVDVSGAAFALDGFPTGTISLRDNLTVFSQGGFEFILLGTVTTNCNVPTALTVSRLANGKPFFRLDGGIEFAMPPEALGNTNGGRLFARSCGFVSMGQDLAPQLQMENFALGGTVRLGGPQGMLIENAVLALDGLTNLYQQSPARPFTITLGGFANIPNGPRLGLQDARFSFVGETFPRFTIAGMSVAQNPDYQAAPGLFLNVTGASFVFLDPNRPFPQVLFPDNVELGVSAQLNIPPGPNPILTGRTDNLRVRLVNGLLHTELSGFGVGINNLEFPPLTLTGEVYIGGLDGANDARALQALAGVAPAARGNGLFFAGKVGGTLNDVGIKALVAFDLRGPIGVCLDGNAGPAGIPLGPTGFLLTGAQGGVSFLNSNGDPCDFSTFYPIGANGRPQANDRLPQDLVRRRPGAAMTWDEYSQYMRRATLDEQAQQQISASARRRAAQASLMTVSSSGSVADFTPMGEHAALAAAGGAPAFPCPTGDCPSPTVNILCQPHPDPDQFPNAVILKFTSLNEKTLNEFGITRQFVQGLGLTDARSIGRNVAASVRGGIDPLVPRADPGLVGSTQATQINRNITGFLDDLETLLAELIRVGVGAALGSSDSVYDRIVEVAHAGVPCPDATVRLAGTFSHASVSTALSATAGVVLSTTGSAGVVGTVNLLGVPVGRTRSFVSATDNRGDPNPSFCGETLIAIGPLEFGQMRSKYECPGCITGMLASFGQLTSCISDTTIRAILERVAPQHRSRPTAQALGALNDAEKLAFIGQIYSMPAVPGLGNCFVSSARSAVDSFNPSFLLCGDVTPKLFGIPLSGSVVQANIAATRTNFAAQFAFSPSFVINNLMLCAATLGAGCQPIFPALDSASMGFGFGVPDFADAVVDAMEGKLSSPDEVARFAKDSFDHMMANGTFTVGYEINPFGFKLADAEARVILPNLTEHPARPGFTYVRPEDRGQNLPSRVQVALTALEAGFLANPLWKGSADDLAQIFPVGSAERTRVENARLSFQKDYFPHGGILGAARLAMPRMIVDAPPAALGVMLDPSKDAMTRLGAASEVISEYVLRTSEVGTLAFYVPAPNPPFFADSQGRPLTPDRLLTAIQTFDPGAIRLPNLYPLEQFFFAGYVEGRLLGVPIARADVAAVPASATGSAFFRLRAGIPEGSWMQAFVDNASMQFEIRQSPPVPIDQFFGGLMDSVNRLNRPGASLDAVGALVNQVGAGVADSLPKVSLELAVNNLRIPDALTNILTTASASARFVAYSPRFNPSFPGDGPIAEVTRLGGIAIQGKLRFADLVTIDDAQLAIFPTDTLALPGLAGRLRVSNLGIPGAALHDAAFDFNSAPAVGQPFLAASGAIDPIDIRNPLDGSPLLSVRPLGSGVSRIAAAFSMYRGANNSIQGSFAIDPARVDFPMLGPDLRVTVHGAKPTDRFSFSTTEPWGASVSIEGQLSVRDFANKEVVRIGSSGGRFSATLTGQGFNLTSLVVSNIPTGLRVTTFPGQPFEREFVIGGSVPAQLRINSDGTFLVSAKLGGDLNLPGLPVPALKGGASITVTEKGLSFTGEFEGGLLAPGVKANGTFAVTSGGEASLTGSATIPAQTFGAIVIRGVSADDLTVNLFHDGYSVPNGARLQVIGVNNDLLSLSPFTNRANADFTATVRSGNFTVPGFFRMSGGRMEFRRRTGVVALEINTPTMTLLPGTPQENRIEAPFTTMLVATDGRFYADSGQKEINLLGALKLQGRLEIGNEPGGGSPALTVSPTSFDFGTINFGTVSNRPVRFSNTGNVPLIVSLLSGSRSFVPAQNDLSIPAGEFREVSLQFRPAVAGPQTNEVRVFMNPGGAQPSLAVRGDARPVPVFQANSTQVRFGDVPLGSTRTSRLIVRNVGTAPMLVTNATLTGPFTISPVVNRQTLQPGEELPLSVTFTPFVLGATNVTLTVRASDQAAPHLFTVQTGNAYSERLVRLREGGPTLRGVAMLNTNTGWAVGDEGAMLRTDNGGRSWLPVLPGFSGNFRAVAVNGTRVAVAGDDGIAGVSTNAGATWRRLTAPLLAARTNHWQSVVWAPIGLANLANIDPGSQLVFVGARNGGGGVIAREASGAFVPALTTTNALRSVASGLDRFVINQSARLIAVGDGGRVVRSATGGTNWTSEIVNGGFIDLRGVAFGGTSAIDSLADAWLVGDSGLLMTAASSTAPFGRVFGPTLENFRAVRVGYLVGDNGSAYRRFAISGIPPFEREGPSGAYDMTALAENDLGVVVAGQFGQIHLRPNLPPVGPFITFDPGALDFGVQPVGRTRTLEVRVFNRGFTPLTVNRIAVNGSSAFVPSVTLISRIPTNSLRTFQVRFTPGAIGDFGAELELGHDESAILYKVPLRGGCQTNAWTLVADPGGASLRDVQFTSTTTGYATTGSDLFKTTNGGTNWTELAVTPPSTVARVSFFSGNLGFIVGGTSSRFFDCAGTCLSFIQRTADGGATWTTATTGVTTPIADLHMVSTTTGFAVGRTRSTALVGGTTIAGEVLRTTDGGTTWTVVTRPVPASGTFSGTAIHALSTTTLFVAGNGQLFRSTNGGTAWTGILNVGGPIRDIHFVNANTGWIVGDGGLFRRTTTGGTVSTAWPAMTPFTSANLQRVHFVDANTGWIAGDDGAVGYLFRSNNGGTGWLAEFRESLVPGTTGPRAVSGTSASAVFAVNGHGVYRSGVFNPAPTGSPVFPALMDFGVVSFGTNVTRVVNLNNLGDVPLRLLGLTLDDDTGEGSFQVVSPATLPIVLPARGAQAVSVRYLPASIARHHVRLLVETDGGGPVLVSDLVGEAEVLPTSIRFITEPAGLRITLDGRSTPTPEVITVVGESKVPNDVINIREWRFGTEHTVEAPPSQVWEGYEYRFKGWEPSRTDSFTMLAKNVPATYVARYVAIKTLTPALAGLVPGYHARRLASVGPELAGQPTPNDVPGGPYIRISGARLEIPAMGGLDVQGSAFLAGDRFEFALEGDPIGDPKLLGIDAGSWRVSFTNNANVTRFVLRAQNPGITMLNKPVTGSSEVLFDVTPNRIVAQLTTFGNTPILPAIVELGPSVVAFTNAVIDAGPARFTSFRAAGDVRLLALPDGSFASVQPFNFFASDQPFTNEFTALPTTLIDTPLIRVTRATGAKLSVSRNRLGEYGVGLTNFNLSLLGGTNTRVSGSIEGSRLRFATGRTIALGALRYDGSGPSSVELDFAGPSIKAVVAEGDLTVPTIAQAIHFDGFTIDSNANFDRKITLPTFDFDGIGVDDGGPIEHNFIRFYRLNGVVGLQFRDRRSFLDNTFKLAIDIDSAGHAAGTFSGSLSIHDFMGCEEIGVGDLTLRYNNSAADGFQFRGNVRLETCLVGTHDFRVKFGSAGGKFCHLFCGPSGCAEDICIP